MDERRLIDRMRAGDADAGRQLVRDHYAAVYRLLVSLTCDTHRAEDLCQETFAAAWKKLDTFDGRSAFSTWLHRIALPSAVASTGTVLPVEEESADEKSAEKSKDAPAKVDKDLLALVKGDVVAAIPIDRDQMILNYVPEWAHGKVDNIGVANNDGGVRTLFAWPKIDKKFADQKFILACYSRETRGDGDGASEIGAYEVTSDWNEQTSWTKSPKTADKPAAKFKFEKDNGWKTFDVTPLIKAQQKAAGATHGVILRFEAEDKTGEKNDWSGYTFVSREGEGGWEARRPVLLVVK